MKQYSGLHFALSCSIQQLDLSDGGSDVAAAVKWTRL